MNRMKGMDVWTTLQLHGAATTRKTTSSHFHCTCASSDWIRYLRIVLRAEKKEEIVDTPLPEEPADNAPAAEKNTYKRACDADLETHARTERFNVSKAFAKTKLAEGAAVGPHVIKTVGYTQRLEKLGFPIGLKLATDFILASLPPSYGNFIANYHMHGAEKGLNELCGMLKIAEADIKKGAGSSHVMAVQNKPKFKKKGNSWKKKKGKAKDEISKPNPPAPKVGPPADAECFHCHGKGHWKRNCKLYLESIKDHDSKGHISENRMKRLHSDGLLTSSDFESYETSDERKRMSKVPYASAVGSIMYAMICTRPDVSYALSVASRYQADLGESHWTLVKNILKYLRRTKDVFLIYGGEEELVVNGYTDVSFQTDTDDSQSQSGFVFTIIGGVVSWKSSKQETVTDSTTEAEYVVAFGATKEAVWMRRFLIELGVFPNASSPLNLHCDNNGAITQAKEPRNHQKNKHVLRKLHLIREFVRRDEIKMCKIHKDLNVVDPLTKALPQPKHEAHMRAMGI
ncbi:unnamed protein product [Miscanthus lutarioriparius]|uniref:CCHC-type domain-containing protein n=1 Tax=Miscanthus lutarioriparius TaxID=422564 RepID=A0A811P0J3_9POAL|nr:unnamed protein product [Miscanthus lutarioriparius]